MEEFFEAFKRQLEYAVEMNCLFNNLMDWAFARWYQTPVHDVLHPGPRRTGLDYSNGGCKYNWTGGIAVGIGTCSDALSAIEYLVYDKKEVAMGELIAALSANWNEHEWLRDKCLLAPKYGNDDDYADKWARRASNAWFDEYEKHHAPHGGIFLGGLFSMTTYTWIGSQTGATPDGRMKSEPLSDAASPTNQADVSGPTAVHMSVSKIDSLRATNGLIFNMKFNSTAVSSRRELSKWADLVRSYMLMGGQTVQYTVVDQAALLEAQKYPEQYKDLVVRTGGYSALFIDLSKEVQDTIIARTEHSL